VQHLELDLHNHERRFWLNYPSLRTLKIEMRYLFPLLAGLSLFVLTFGQSNDENLEHRIASGIGEGAQKAADGVTYVRDSTGHLVNAAGERINEAGETVGRAASNIKEDLSRKADAASDTIGQKLENAGRDLQDKPTYNAATMNSLSLAATLLTFTFISMLW